MLRALPLLLLDGALMQVASAQSTGTQTEVPGGGGFLASLFSGLGALSLLALVVGLISPNSFRFLFKERTSRKRVGWTLGAAMLFFVTVSGSMSPTQRSSATQGSATPNATNQNAQVRVAENRAKAAEARAAKAERAAASANAKSKERASAKADAKSEASSGETTTTDPAPETAPAKEPLPDNIEVVDIPGVGKREAGVVDEVVYVIGKAETTAALGPQMYRREADGVFYVLQVAANNTSKTTHDVSTMLMKLLDDQGREFDPSTEGSMALSMDGEKSAEPFSAQVQPGVTKKLTLVYDAPKGASGLKLHIPAGFGFGKSADIRVPTAGE